MKITLNGEMFEIHLKEYTDRIERLEGEKKEISAQINTVYQEAESKGFDKKALKQALKMLTLQKADRDRQLELTSQYLDEIGA
jgi:uncharacterized protein (UPF0335 family)